MQCGRFFTLLLINRPTHLGSQSTQTPLLGLVVLAPCFDGIVPSLMCGLILCTPAASLQAFLSASLYPVPVRLVIWTRRQPPALHWYWSPPFPINTSTLYILCWKSHSKHLWRSSISSFKSFFKACLVSDYPSLQCCTAYRESGFFTQLPRCRFKFGLCVFTPA